MSTVLDKGNVTLTLADEQVTLTPSVNAFNLLAGAADSYSTILQRLAIGHVETVKLVLRAGLKLKDDKVKELPGKIMLTGVHNVANPCSDFVYRLFNGGKSMEEVEAERKAKAAAKAEDEEADGDDAANPPLA